MPARTTPPDRPVLTVPLRADAGLWVPLVDGTERIGVMEFTYDIPESGEGTPCVPQELRTASARYAGLVADLLSTKSNYGDVF